MKTWTDVRETLLLWQRDPSVVEDDGIEPPTAVALDVGMRFVGEAVRVELVQGVVVPGGEGDVSFEWSGPRVFVRLTLDRDGRAEIVLRNSGRWTRAGLDPDPRLIVRHARPWLNLLATRRQPPCPHA